MLQVCFWKNSAKTFSKVLSMCFLFFFFFRPYKQFADGSTNRLSRLEIQFEVVRICCITPLLFVIPFACSSERGCVFELVTSTGELLGVSHLRSHPDDGGDGCSCVVARSGGSRR